MRFLIITNLPIVKTKCSNHIKSCKQSWGILSTTDELCLNKLLELYICNIECIIAWHHHLCRNYSVQTFDTQQTVCTIHKISTCTIHAPYRMVHVWCMYGAFRGLCNIFKYFWKRCLAHQCFEFSIFRVLFPKLLFTV